MAAMKLVPAAVPLVRNSPKGWLASEPKKVTVPASSWNRFEGPFLGSGAGALLLTGSATVPGSVPSEP
jgi:hypothetical protein